MRITPTTLLLLLSLAGCGERSGDDDDAGAAGSCDTIADCDDGYLCLAYGSGGGACTLDCSLSADECGAGASCEGVGSVEVSACQDEDRVPDEGAPPDEDDRPRLLCETDADCAVYGDDVVCAEFQGARECSLTCNSDDDCNPPPIAGVTTIFSVCDADHGDSSRDVCLPNEDCWADPTACIEVDGW